MIENFIDIERKQAKTSEAVNILLAEDDIDDVFIFRLALNKLNIVFELNHAENGKKLFEYLKDLLPDIIFLDINMPYKDGLSCLMEIRRNSLFDNVPVILISGHTHSGYIQEAFANGANYYLIKAINIEQLAEHLRSIFSINWKKVMYYPPINQFVISE